VHDTAERPVRGKCRQQRCELRAIRHVGLRDADLDTEAAKLLERKDLLGLRRGAPDEHEVSDAVLLREPACRAQAQGTEPAGDEDRGWAADAKAGCARGLRRANQTRRKTAPIADRGFVFGVLSGAELHERSGIAIGIARFR
jgi:hypothetical protein